MPNVDELVSQVKTVIQTAHTVLDRSDWDDFYASAMQELEGCEADRNAEETEDDL